MLDISLKVINQVQVVMLNRAVSGYKILWLLNLHVESLSQSDTHYSPYYARYYCLYYKQTQVFHIVGCIFQ